MRVWGKWLQCGWNRMSFRQGERDLGCGRRGRARGGIGVASLAQRLAISRHASPGDGLRIELQ